MRGLAIYLVSVLFAGCRYSPPVPPGADPSLATPEECPTDYVVGGEYTLLRPVFVARVPIEAWSIYPHLTLVGERAYTHHNYPGVPLSFDDYANASTRDDGNVVSILPAGTRIKFVRMMAVRGPELGFGALPVGQIVSGRQASDKPVDLSEISRNSDRLTGVDVRDDYLSPVTSR